MLPLNLNPAGLMWGGGKCSEEQGKWGLSETPRRKLLPRGRLGTQQGSRRETRELVVGEATPRSEQPSSPAAHLPSAWPGPGLPSLPGPGACSLAQAGPRDAGRLTAAAASCADSPWLPPLGGCSVPGSGKSAGEQGDQRLPRAHTCPCSQAGLQVCTPQGL